MDDFFKVGDWYIDQEEKIKGKSHRVIEAIRREKNTKSYLPDKFFVRLIARWTPEEGLSFKRINSFPMLLLSFSPKKWIKVPKNERTEAVLRLFEEKGNG